MFYYVTCGDSWGNSILNNVVRPGGSISPMLFNKDIVFLNTCKDFEYYLILLSSFVH